MKRTTLALALCAATLLLRAHEPGAGPHIQLANGPHPRLAAMAGPAASTTSSCTPTIPAAQPQLPPLRTIPYFRDTYTSNGTKYAYYMPGTNPRTSHTSTVVRDEIIPIRFVFADGTVFDPTPTLPTLTRSPLFRSAPFASGTTQYGDAMQRAGFWKYVRGTNYHVLLAAPVVSPLATVNVPAADGHTEKSTYGGTIGVIDQNFFMQTLVPAVLTQLNVDPTMLAVLWSYNIDIGLVCGGYALGLHDAETDSGVTTAWTWAWSSWHTADTAAPGSNDIKSLSHEIAEWYGSPFGINPAPAWTAPFYGCNGDLEVGDPVAGHSFTVNGLHLQDEAFFSWFARQTPSIGINSLYDYMGVFTGPSPACTP